MSFDVDAFRKNFPVLSTPVNGQDYYYFDTAATSLKPKVVAERIYNYYLFEVANIHRGSHFLGRKGTENFEAVRGKVQSFINAKSDTEIVFVKGVTEAMNILAYTYGDSMNKGDVVVVGSHEHHSNIVPWLLLKERRGVQLEVLHFNENGSVNEAELQRIIKLKPKIVSLILYSNVTGVRFDVEKVLEAFKKTSTLTVVDAAQAVLHERIDVQKIDCDYLTFSAHKMFGPFGTGVLYGKKERLEKCKPFMGGGSMISQVGWDQLVLQNAPHKFEAGTPNIADVIGFGTALDFLEKFGVESWREHTRELVSTLEEGLKEFPKIKIIGPTLKSPDTKKADIVSFVYEGAHASDVGEILDQMGVAVRAGHHCAQPLMKNLGVSGTIRVSFGPYNSNKDVAYLLEALKKTSEIL
jgi:cysteine desulfurase / selenocysteine lyase